MATQIPTPITHVYKEINTGKYATVKHYELTAVQNGIPQLSQKINISQNRNFALSMPLFWLKEHNGKKWQSFCTTGLFKTDAPNLYKGDTQKKCNLLLFRFSDNQEILTVYYFKNF
ncbi:MAG: hypothetical protein ACK5NB_08515, partial [Flavobacteriaceae bacterium]